MPYRCRKQLTNTVQKKWSFPLTISLANVTKSTISCGFGLISEEILNGKLHFLCSISCVANQLIGFYMLGALALNGLTQHFTHSLRGSLKEISAISIKKTSQMQVSNWRCFGKLLNRPTPICFQKVVAFSKFPLALKFYQKINLQYKLFSKNILIEWKNCVTIWCIENISLNIYTINRYTMSKFFHI